ncbi:gastrula zinc finger protein XlCGF46.1-like [Phlebotomus papatasi]|uniref:gastrula zinc finger protein XlCGF46.1-like n=1 Tax=Phlebotomus papatasi TaxID=29031 RepID=UPI002483CCD9|nr:gastrula zinc finger protein XlCGF46.1-like [Phlebotomus papatasi]
MECLNILERCRGCQIKTQKESQIFIFATHNLSDIFQETTSLDIHQNDGLPEVLCFNCYNRLLEAYNFRQMCTTTALHFQQILALGVPEQKYTPPEVLCDPLMVTKSDPDDDDMSNFSNTESPPEEKYSPPENKYTPPEASESSSLAKDNEPIKEDETEPDYVLPKKRGRKPGKKLGENSEKPYRSHKKKKPLLPGEVEKPVKRQGQLTLECHLCNTKFRMKEWLEAHMRVKHQGMKKATQCKVCLKEFTQVDYLRMHMATQHGKTYAFPCKEPNCKKQYVTEEGLQNHMKSWHDPENPKERKRVKTYNYVCELCGKAFECPAYLKKHSYSHGGERPFACSQCPRRFYTKNQISVHILRHEGIKNHVCTICGLRTVTASALRIHVNSHTKDNLWPCEFCDFKSTTQAGRKHHVKAVHRGEKKYECAHCNKSFGHLKTLRNHERIHTGEKPYACNVCGKRFIQLTALNYHKKMHLNT